MYKRNLNADLIGTQHPTSGRSIGDLKVDCIMGMLEPCASYILSLVSSAMTFVTPCFMFTCIYELYILIVFVSVRLKLDDNINACKFLFPTT